MCVVSVIGSLWSDTFQVFEKKTHFRRQRDNCVGHLRFHSNLLQTPAPQLDHKVLFSVVVIYSGQESEPTNIDQTWKV